MALLEIAERAVSAKVLVAARKFTRNQVLYELLLLTRPETMRAITVGGSGQYRCAQLELASVIDDHGLGRFGLL